MSATYRISVDVGVQDAVALWTMVSAQLSGVYGLSDDEVIDTIGPRQDPDVQQCMTMLLDPARWNGCVVESLDCTALPGSTAVTPFTPRRVDADHNGVTGVARKVAIR